MICSVARHEYNLDQDLKTSSLRSVLVHATPPVLVTPSPPSSPYARNHLQEWEYCNPNTGSAKIIIPIVQMRRDEVVRPQSSEWSQSMRHLKTAKRVLARVSDYWSACDTRVSPRWGETYVM